MNLGRSREEILDLITPSSQLGDALIKREFENRTRSKRLSLSDAQALILAAAADNPVTTRELLCLSDICDYAGIVDTAIRYLSAYVGCASYLIGKKGFGMGVPLEPVSQKNRRLYLNAIASAARMPQKFALPDHPRRTYSFRDLSAIARLIRSDRVFLFSLHSTLGGRGGHVALYDCFYVVAGASFSDVQRASTAVHEAFHSVQDRRRLNGDVGHIEVAAHLVQAVWLLSQKKPLHGQLQKFQDVAEDIAPAKGNAPFRVEWDNYKALRQSLPNTYEPKNPASSMDGIATSGIQFRKPAP